MTRVLDSYELSPLQAGMLFHALREQDPATYVEQIVVTLREPLDAGRLREAWDRLVDRHAVLRTRLRWKGLAQPVQEVIDGARMPVERFERSDGLERLIDEQRARGFDLEQAPLMRLALVRGGEGEQTMVWTLHHMLLDGHGRTLLLQELFARYQGAAEPAEPRPYRDYIEWLRGLDSERAKDYWQRALAGFRGPTPLAVASGPIGDGHAVHEWRLSAELTRALRKRARAARITLNVLLQGAWALLLHRYSGVPDVVFGVTRACRASALEGAAGIVGPLINTVPLRVRVDPAAELGAWLEGLREPQLALRDYEHTPLVDVQRWSEVPRGTPLFETLFVFAQHTLEAQLRALGGAWSTRGFRNVGNTHYPLALAAYGDEELLLQLQYSRRRFADDVVQRMAGHLQTLLEGMAADPRVKLRDLPLLTAAERHQVVTAWNETRAPYPPARCAHELVEEQARLRPAALAAEDGERRLSYRELDERAERLAARLRKRGVQPGALVAVRLGRSVDMLVALLAVWKAGAAYVPIDPDYPAERVRFMLEDSRASVVLTEQHLADLEDEPLTASQTSLPERLAYVIYTSGSTGAPKGVPITHRSLFNLICWHREAYDVGPHDRATQVAGPAFDGAVWEIWPYLAAGASVHVPGERTRLDPSLLVRWLVERRITLAFLPTPLVEAALREPWPSACTLRVLLTGGDRLNQGPPPGLPFRLVNHYGPTENTVVSTCAEVSPNERVPSIGRPLPNTQAYVVDRHLQPVPVGVPGELLVGGVQLSLGYWNRPELTASQFIQHFGKRLYRTGDQVRWLPDGNLEFLGRIDDQVKIRGYRVELGEIESVLAGHPGVRQAAVSVHESSLVAHLVGEADLAHVRAHLRGKLPDYMVPGEFVRLSRMPFTPNGKLDRKALPAPERTAAAEFVAPATPTEQALAELWQRVLRIERIGAKDHFFESGGHSLLAMQLVGGVRERFGVALPIKNLFERPILADLAQAIDALSWLERSKAPPAHAAAREETLL